VRKKLLMSAFFLVITIAMAAAATMAWFTDNGTAEDAQFTAGTVSIEAGRKVICDGTDNNGEYAVRREVLPFRVVEAKQGYAGINNDLPVKETRSNEEAVLTLGTEQDESNFYSLGFGGEMILEFDAALFDPEIVIVVEDTWGGNYPDETAEVSVSMDGQTWIVIGEANNENLDKNQTLSQFKFSEIDVDINYIKYIKIKDTTDVKPFRDRNYSSSDNSVDGFDLNTVKLTGYIADEDNWNPGDTNYTRYTVKNTGTKAINLRAKLTGGWYEYKKDKYGGKWEPVDLPADNVVISPVSDGWEEHDGYFYYKPDIPGTYTEPDEKERTVELRVSVHLIGEQTDDRYQGKRYILKAEFEAVQASNNAAKDVWNVSIYD